MSKNLIPEICKLLGEEFKLDIDGEIYQITEKAMFRKKMNDEGAFDMWEEVPCSFIKLLSGGAEVVKLSWKPKFGDRYFGFFEFYEKLRICRYDIWRGTVEEEAQYRCGWIFRTRAEAEAALPDVAKELGVEYEL